MLSIWESAPIGSGVEILCGQHILASEYSANGGGTPYLTGPSDFPDGAIVVSKFVTQPKVLCRANDILLTVKGSGVGKLTVADGVYCISRQLVALRPRSWHSGFLFQILRSIAERLNIQSTGTIPGITKEQIAEWNIPVPPLLEQRKIAEILSCWDDGIAKLKELLSAYLELKTSVIFASLGDSRDETVERQKLGEILEFVGSGITPKGGSEVYLQQGIPFIRSQNVHFNKLVLDDVAFISEELHSQLSRTHLRVGDVLLNITGASIGRCTVVPEQFMRGNVNQHVCILRVNRKKADPQFLVAYLSSARGQYQIRAAQAGLSREGLNYEQIRALEIPLPSLEKQKCIGVAVECLANLVERVEFSLAEFARQKQALMQKLLTGKIRVKV